ncbi:MAG: ATP-binding protein [Myxococcota bacterium]
MRGVHALYDYLVRNVGAARLERLIAVGPRPHRARAELPTPGSLAERAQAYATWLEREQGVVEACTAWLPRRPYDHVALRAVVQAFGGPTTGPWAAVGPEGLSRSHFDDVVTDLPMGLSDGIDRTDPLTAADLLLAAQRVVAFTGRAAELEGLEAWRDSAASLSVFLLHGPGGAGKTRLAQHLARRSLGQGWEAGFLDRGATATHLEALAVGVQPLLVVVDYAETRVGQVVEVLRGVLEATAGTRPVVRVLLLARAAGEWWDQWPRTEGAPRAIRRIVAQSPAPQRLKPVNVERQAFWDAAWPALAAQPLLGLASVPETLPFPERLEDDLQGRPLYLSMAAFLQLKSGQPLPKGDDRYVLDEMLEHERTYWQQALRHETGGQRAEGAHLERLLVALRLREGCTEAELSEVLVHANSSFVDRHSQARAVARLYTDRSGEAKGPLRRCVRSSPTCSASTWLTSTWTGTPDCWTRCSTIRIGRLSAPPSMCFTDCTRAPGRCGG